MSGKKDDPADVAKTGFDDMLRGDGDVVAGMKNKIQSAVANVTPAPFAKQHRKMAEPGSAKDKGRCNASKQHFPNEIRMASVKTKGGVQLHVRAGVGRLF